MSIRDLLADICDALNENEKTQMVVEDAVFSHPTKEVSVEVRADVFADFDNKHLSGISRDNATGIRYIAYVFYVSLKKYGYEVNNVVVKHTSQQITNKVA
jgi:hypothetical protein